MNFDDILGKLLPLFEKKVAFSMAMSERAMSLEEKKEASKTDLEYRKLEAQITSDKDKLEWEKKKLTTAVKADYDLQTLKNSGMLDLERAKGLNEKDKQKIMEEGANSRAKLNADTESNKAYLTTLGTILGHAQEVSQTGVDGITKTSRPTAEVGNAARSLMEQTGLARQSLTPPSPAIPATLDNVVTTTLKGFEATGDTVGYANYVRSLPADVQAAIKNQLPPPATPAPGIGAVVPATGVAPPAGRVVVPAVPTPFDSTQPYRQSLLNQVGGPITPVVNPVRPTLQPTGGRFIEGVSPRELQGLSQEDYVAQRKQKALPGTITTRVGDNTFTGTRPILPTTSNIYGQEGALSSVQQDDEEKRRALRRARGLIVGF